MNSPLVSVIIPTCKRTDFLDEAILSVVNQTYKNLEIIVCDDNAKFLDVRKNVVNIVSKYPQVKLIQNTENLGGSGNRNVGIQHANGELISFLDDDDVYDKTRIEKVVDCYLANRGKHIGVIYTHCFFTDENLHILGEYAINPEENVLFQHMRGCLCATSQWTIPKEVFLNVGGFEITPNKQDSIMLLKILGEGYGALCVPEKLSYYRGHKKGRISGNYEKLIIGEYNYLKWLHKYFDKLQPEQQRIVESCAQKRILVGYSGMGKRKEVLSCIKKIVQYEGFRGISVYSILYLIASPEFYKMIYYKLVGAKRPYNNDANHVDNAIHNPNDTIISVQTIQEIHKDKVLVTILTSAYNRADLLLRLFQSLLKQTCNNFEWLIVDDGSTDDTEAIVKEWIQEAQFPIRYFKQENGGKHRAINRGLREARGELFFIVDSDDYLTSDAIETIEKRYESIQGDESFCGVCLLKVDKDLNKVGSDFPYETLDCSCLDFRYKYGSSDISSDNIKKPD